MSSRLDEVVAAKLADRYQIKHEIGKGGVTIAYLASDNELGRDVALKVFRPELVADVGKDTIRKQLGISARLVHPNIVPIYHVGLVDDLLYYSTRYFPSGSLRDKLERDGRLEVGVALAVSADIATALSYAHGNGVLHGDIKPEHIYIQHGLAMLANAGFTDALKRATGDRLTGSGIVFGTPAYISPEALTGGPIDARSDVYSLGLVLYEMLAGETPFSGPSAQAIMMRHIQGAIPRIDNVRKDVPPELVRGLTIALAKLPADRYQDAVAFLQALTDLLKSMAGIPPAQPRGWIARLFGRRPKVTGRSTTDPSRLASERYVIEQEIGRGGMATVYLARDTKHQAKVAVKVLKPEYAKNVGVERFLREIKTTAGLSHPHILPVLDSGEVNGQLFYTMPYVDEGSLRGRLNEGRPALEFTSAIARDVASALDYAHKNSKVHRDIKPENILLNEDRARIADFGIALDRTLPNSERITITGYSPGTPQYMSPEQLTAPVRVDGRSDMYGMACVIFEMIAGRTPFVGETAESVIAQQVDAAPPDLRSLVPDIPGRIADALRRALAKDPDDRFETCGAFAKEV